VTSVSEPVLLALRGIAKSFGSARALDDVDLTVSRGEILGLVGENGAGKSTLIKILTGLYTADGGTIELDGGAVQINRPADAQSLGVHVIHQDRHLAGRLTVAENLYLGHLPRTGWLDRGGLERRAAEDIERCTGQSLDAGLLTDELTVAQQQLIQITRAVLAQPRVLILDEPTAPLASGEVEQLFGTLRRLRAQGVGIIYVSHYLQELQDITDRITVLRNGRNAGDVRLGTGGTLQDVVELMVGRTVTEFDHARTPRTPAATEPALETKDLAVPGVLEGLDLQVRPGEVVAITGLVGSGVDVVADAITGVTRASGNVRVNGRTVRDSVGFVAAGGAYVPSNRRRDGLLTRHTVAENLTAASLRKISRFGGLLSKARERALSGRLIDRLDIRPADGTAVGGSLSGGNQQKVVLGKWLATEASVFVLDQPTSGVDVGSRAQIYAHLNDLVDDGAAVLVVTVDLEELVGIADQILVLHRGRVVADLSGHDVTTDRVLAIASGAESVKEPA
jgi:ribose transport system ATP-binding protein